LTAYGADKLGCELHAHVGAIVHGIASTGLRFFNVYGARQDPASPYSGVISIFCDRLLRGEALEIYGDGHQLRDFVYVLDVVNFLLAAMATTSEGARVFNVCTGVGTSILELANTIAELCRTDPQIRFLPERAGDIRASIGSDVLAGRGLGIQAKTRIREGLAHTLQWLTEQRHEASGGQRLDRTCGSSPTSLPAGRRTAAIKNR
jgi:UDP-glucose 4-epimerase